MPKICAIYVRKSKISDNSDSMETQIQMCQDYLNQQFPQCTIRIYDKDYGVTGHSIAKRKDFQRMMQDVKEEIINVVAIQRYDRIARNTRDFCNIYNDMVEVGCELVSVSQRIDTSTPYGKKFMYDLASTAELEWALNSERHKDTNRYARLNRKCALSPYALPFGYKAERIDGIRRMVIDKEKEHIVRDAISYYMQHENKMKTTRYLNDKYDLKLSHSFIERLIASDFYHGAYREVPDYCEAYITPEEHAHLRSISKKHVRYYSNDRQFFLFTGLVVCPICGLKMESQSQVCNSGHRYYYYRCYNTYRTGKCHFKGNINERVVEEYLREKLQGISSDFAEEFDKSIGKGKKVVDLSQYRAEMDRLNKLFQKGRIDEDYYDREYDRLEHIIEESTREKEPQQRHTAKELKSMFADGWQDKYDQLSRESKRAYWSKVIKRIEFNEDKSIKKIHFL